MPLLGYYLGSYFKDMFFVVDHFIAFFLLGIIGLDMISEGIRSTQVVDENVDIKTMLIAIINIEKRNILSIFYYLCNIQVYNSIAKLVKKFRITL